MEQRTPKNYNGTHSPAKQIRDLGAEFLGELSRKCGERAGDIYLFWNELLGETMAPLTEPISYVSGVLTIKVKSGALYSVLRQHEQPRLLRRLKERFPTIQSLRFRI